MGMALSYPVSDRAGLHDAAPNIGQGDAADHRAIGFAKHDERIGSVGGDVFGVTAEPTAKTRTGEIVRWPDRLPGSQVLAARFAQLCPLWEIGHLRCPQQQAVTSRH